jgi:hypothetical protein
MKRHIYKIAALLGLCLAIAATPARAQSIAPLKAHIPFSFAVRDKILPAGDYAVESIKSASGVCMLLFRGLNNRTGVFILPMTVQDQSRVAQQAGLMFHRYGEACFLSQVRASEYVYELPETHAERAMRRRSARRAEPHLAKRIAPETFTIALVNASE